jgi:hypothetical protein
VRLETIITPLNICIFQNALQIINICMHDAPCPFTTQRKMARDMRKIMRLVVVAIVLTAYIASNGCVVNGRSIQSEDLELEKELAAINKPSIKTIEVWLCFYVFRVFISLKNFTKDYTFLFSY